MSPSISLISSVGSGGKYNFPHLVTLEALREGVERTASSGEAHRPDWELNIHYTAEEDTAGPLGSMALVIPPKGREVGFWRFRDSPGEPVDLSKACRLVPG